MSDVPMSSQLFLIGLYRIAELSRFMKANADWKWNVDWKCCQSTSKCTCPPADCKYLIWCIFWPKTEHYSENDPIVATIVTPLSVLLIANFPKTPPPPPSSLEKKERSMFQNTSCKLFEIGDKIVATFNAVECIAKIKIYLQNRKIVLKYRKEKQNKKGGQENAIVLDIYMKTTPNIN